MIPTVQSPQVEIHDVAIDHVNVREPKTGSVKSLRALLPFLTVLIAGTSAVFSFGFKMLQDRGAKVDRKVEERRKADEAWRDALVRSIGNGQSFTLLALEMETFAEDPKYGNQAKSIVYLSLPKIENEIEFDAAFHGALDSTLDEDQDALVSVVRKLSLELENLHDGVRKKALAATGDKPTLASFVKSPESFLADDGKALGEANALKWKLETASGGLSSLWHGTDTRPPLRPGQEVDLTGLIFLKNDFRGVDFSQVSDMSETFFLGKCKVDAAAVAKGATAVCEAD